MALAVGAKTLKMKFGHHGANHPVKDMDDGRGDYVAESRFGRGCRTRCRPTCASRTSLFDGSLQGFTLTDKPAFCFRVTRKPRPARQDVAYLFDRFIKLMKDAKQ